MQGTVKWFNVKKGFGFIQGEDNKDYFVHHTQVPQGTFLRENDSVTFEAVDTDKGIQAQNISLAKGGKAPAAEEPAQESEDYGQDSAEDSEDFGEDEPEDTEEEKEE